MIKIIITVLFVAFASSASGKEVMNCTVQGDKSGSYTSVTLVVDAYNYVDLFHKFGDKKSVHIGTYTFSNKHNIPTYSKITKYDDSEIITYENIFISSIVGREVASIKKGFLWSAESLRYICD